MTAAGDPVFPPRPTSPFLILVLGVTSTVLAAEWIRFQLGPLVAAPPALFGLALTLRAVVRAYRARRRWRHALGRRSLHPAPELLYEDGDDRRDAPTSVRGFVADASSAPSPPAEAGARPEGTGDAQDGPVRDDGDASVPRGDARRRDTVI